jgi:hypothetical protein
LAFASCTRFSPNTRCPASITGMISGPSKVLLTAMSVTSPARRPAAWVARNTPFRTVFRPSWTMN